MEYQKIIKAHNSILPIILALFFGFHGIPFLMGGIAITFPNGDFSTAGLPFIIVGLLELVAIGVCLVFAFRNHRHRQAYQKAQLNGGLQVYPEYIYETGTRINKVPEYEIVFLHETPLGIKHTIRGVPINDPLFYETMKTVPLTIYPLGDEYYTSSKELVQFTHNLMMSLNIRRREIMKELQSHV